MKKWKVFKLKYLLLAAVIYIITVFIRVVLLENATAVLKENVNQDGLYPIEFVRHKNAKDVKLNSDSIIVIDPLNKSSFSLSSREYVSPIALSIRSLSFFESYKKNKSINDSVLFMKNATWLLENQSSSGAWYFNENYSFGDKTLVAPWASGLAQGLGISVLLRAFTVTHDSLYLKAAGLALNPMNTLIEDGGVMSSNEFGVFIEEYPYKTGANHVFNGAMYSIIGIKELCDFGLRDGCVAFDRYIGVLENILPKYNLGNWSAYSLDVPNLRNHFNYASPWYHKIHIVQLEVLYDVTGNELFKEYAQLFESQNDGFVHYLVYSSYILYQDFVSVVNFFKRIKTN